MVYFINKYDGTQVAAIAEGAMDTTSTSLKLLGRNFINYGEIISENFVHLMENFASPNPPAGVPLSGQLWFNTTDNKMYLFNGTTWVVATAINVGNTDGDPNNNGDGPNALPPSGTAEGDLYWDADTQQLWGWTEIGTPHWVLIGPPAPDSANSRLEYQQIDGHDCLVITIDGQYIAIWSAVSFTPTTAPWNSIFPAAATGVEGIVAGLTFRRDDMNSIRSGSHYPSKNNSFNLGSASLRWDTLHARVVIADNIQQTGQGSIAFNKFMRTDQTNVPDVNVAYDLGSTTNRYSKVYATDFIGTSTATRLADLAERFAADEPMDEGTVVKLGGSAEITKTTEAADIDVLGVVSTRAAFKMNAEAGDDNSHPFVAFAGRVPCKVVGKVIKGERLITSNIPGVAIGFKTAYPEIAGFGMNRHALEIIGRALESKGTDEVGLVMIVVGTK